MKWQQTDGALNTAVIPSGTDDGNVLLTLKRTPMQVTTVDNEQHQYGE
jgi:hypothetical protein